MSREVLKFCKISLVQELLQLGAAIILLNKLHPDVLHRGHLSMDSPLLAWAVRNSVNGSLHAASASLLDTGLAGFTW